MQTVFAIALGGALGAVSRHYVAVGVTRHLGNEFPYGIFFVNILGSLLMGLCLVLLTTKFDGAPEVKAFITVGFLGAFTTFSTYSMEIMLLIQRGDWSLAALYAFGSMLLGLAGLYLGMTVGRGLS